MNERDLDLKRMLLEHTTRCEHELINPRSAARREEIEWVKSAILVVLDGIAEQRKAKN